MDLLTFEELLDRNGADLGRWAPADRAAAATLIAASPKARALFGEMAEIEGVLRSTRVPDEAGPAQAMASRAMCLRQETPVRRLASQAGWAAAAAAALLLGISIGDLASGPRYDEPDHVMAIAFDAGGTADVD